MTDVLIKGGTVIDPAQGIHEILDVAITGGRVEKIAHDLPVAGVTEVIDASNKIVTPTSTAATTTATLTSYRAWPLA